MNLGAIAAVVSIVVALVVLPIQAGHIAAQAGEVIEDPETYAVYAAVLPMQSTGTDRLTEIAILQETRVAPCSHEESNIPAEWRPVVDSFREENARVRQLQPGFQLNVPYSLVTFAELKALMEGVGYVFPWTWSGEQSPGLRVFERLPGGRLVAVSAVGFNDEKTRAMLTVQYNCFPAFDPPRAEQRCPFGTLLAREKIDGRWVRATHVSRRIRCGGIA